MAAFVFRRILISILVLLGASFLVYMMISLSLDPLKDLRESNSPSRDVLIAQRVDRLDLETPWGLRYLDWLRGLGGCIEPFGLATCDLGQNLSGQSVNVLLGDAIGATLRLVTLATVVAWIVGVTVGIVSALRQHSGLDYSVTFVSFLFFSLPAFWVAVLFKEFIALPVNRFLEDPSLPFLGYAIVFVLVGLLLQAMLAGDPARRAVTFVVAGGAAAGVLALMVSTDWFLDPGLGQIGVAISIAVVAFLITLLLAGLHHRRAQITAAVVAVAGAVGYLPIQSVLNNQAGTGTVVLVVLGAIAFGAVVGVLVGGYDRSLQARLGGLIGFGVAFIIVIDRLLQAWGSYINYSLVQVRSGPIPTVGSGTPRLEGNYWILTVDTLVHLALPTLALVMVSIATYSRYSRAGMLDVLNQDYIRTARAKGLPERTVVVRHAFRNSLIPLATIVATDVGALLGGAVITETVFGIPGMGLLFTESLRRADPNPVMAFFIVVAAFAIVFNLIADLSYALLDPRVRSH